MATGFCRKWTAPCSVQLFEFGHPGRVFLGFGNGNEYWRNGAAIAILGIAFAVDWPTARNAGFKSIGTNHTPILARIHRACIF
jgi:hypothetical protein